MRRNYSILILFVLVAFQGFNNLYYLELRRTSFENKSAFVPNKIFKVKGSETWFLNGTSIYINDNNPEYNWSKTEAENGWCSGNGTQNDPYIIENVIIDANNSGNCIEIRSSSKHFIIQNCTLYNSGAGADEAGVFLSNVDNGKLIENNISNNYHGIFLKSSDYNLVSMNKIGDNDGNGVYLFSTSNNTILNNNITSNSANGIFFDRVNIRNRIEHNNILYNYHGINFDREYGDCEYNEILFNTISENRKHGITFVNFRQFYYGNITGNFITYNLGNGIYIKGGVHNTYFINNTISHNQEIGIYLDYWSLRGCDNNIIERNTINHHSNYGIRSWQSDNNDIIQNNFTGNDIGVRLDESDNTFVAKNTIINGSCAFLNAQNYWCNFTENKMINCGFYFYPQHGYDVTTSIDSNNTVNGKSVYFYVGQSNLRSDNFSNAGQIILYDCSSSMIANLNLTKGTVGIFLYNCFNITISNTNLSYNRVWGLIIRNSNNNTIMKNIIKNIKGNAPNIDPTTGGMRLYTGDYNKIFENEISRNSKYGVYVESTSQNNLLYLNNFTENLQNVENYNAINQWDNGSVGNYWSDYARKDINDDGIGDSSYNIYKYGEDNFPIYWDAPLIQINSPNTNESFETNPSFSISVVEGIADTIWYSLDNRTTNVSTSGLTGIISDTEWYKMEDGLIQIVFFINDSKGYIDKTEVDVIKLTDTPQIDILSPTLNQEFSAQAPEFTLNITDSSLIVSVWYTIDGGISNYTCSTPTATIDTIVWEATQEGQITITFYAEDEVGNIGTKSVIVLKRIPSQQGISGYNISTIMLSIFLVTIIAVVKKKKNSVF